MIEHSKDEVEHLVDKYVAELRGCVLEAWDLWRASDHAAHLHWKTVMGNAMCNYFLRVAKHRFHNKSAHVFVETKRPYIGLYVESALYVRFKKGKGSLRTSNVQTKAAKAFLDKSQNIDALQGLTRLELVYVPTRDELDIQRIMLTCKDKGQIAWTIDLLAQVEPEQKIIEIPPQPTPQGSPADRVIKKSKGKADDTKRKAPGEG